MSGSTHGRLRPEARRGVTGGLSLATVYVVGYWFFYGTISVAPGSPWGIGRTGLNTGLLPGTIHLGFFLVPAFVAGGATVAVQRWRSSASSRRADLRFLLALVASPVLAGAAVGVVSALVVFGRLLLSGTPGELVSFVLVLGLALYVIAVNGVLVLALVGAGTATGYLVVGAVAAILCDVAETP